MGYFTRRVRDILYPMRGAIVLTITLTWWYGTTVQGGKFPLLEKYNWAGKIPRILSRSGVDIANSLKSGAYRNWELPTVCATVYEHDNFEGSSMQVNNAIGKIVTRKPWNGLIKSVKVTPGCTFKGYTNNNAQGYPLVESTTDFDFHDHMNSWTCQCGEQRNSCSVPEGFCTGNFMVWEDCDADGIPDPKCGPEFVSSADGCRQKAGCR